MALAGVLVDVYRSLWGLIQQAAQAKTDQGAYAFRSTDVVAAASQLAREAGSALTFAEAGAIPGLFSLARSNARAADALATADLTLGIDASMVGEWPTAPSLAVQAAQPSYMAKAQFDYINALGETQTGWVTITGITQLPSTVGNLQLRLQGAALSSYTATKADGGTPLTDAEVMTQFMDFTSIQLFAA
jgi:hypothetical protein